MKIVGGYSHCMISPCIHLRIVDQLSSMGNYGLQILSILPRFHELSSAAGPKSYNVSLRRARCEFSTMISTPCSNGILLSFLSGLHWVNDPCILILLILSFNFFVVNFIFLIDSVLPLLVGLGLMRPTTCRAGLSSQR